MPKTVVRFDQWGAGACSRTKKRVPNANHRKKSEIKKYDPFSPGYNGAGTILKNYEFVNVKTNSSITGLWGSYYPVSLKYPNVGTAGYNRIGDQYFLKAIRFKGNIEMRPAPIPTAWRLLLLRGDNYETSQGDTNAYKGLFRGPDIDTSSVDNEYVSWRNWFYSRIKDVTDNNISSVKVLASGVSPSNYIEFETSDISVGATSGAKKGTEQTKRYTFGNSYAPLDVVIKANDWINADITYTLVFEVSNIYGTIINQVASGSLYSWAWSTNVLDYNVKINFCAIAYFTDP